MRTKATIVFAILAFMTTHAWALTATVNGITWTYTVSNGVASVGGGTPSTTAIPKGTAGDITIPATLGGKPVTSINYWAFYNCNSLSSVTIPDSITHIRQYAFYSSSISSMTIPDSVVCVEESAFASCASLQSVVIGNGVTSIGKNAFISCGLSSVVIPGNVSDIGVQAFKDCRQINSVIIQNGVTSIGQSMFQGCTLLQSLSLPISLKSIGGNAFQGCLRLESVSIPNRLERIESGAFQSCSGLQSLSIPSSVKNIGSGAFQGCSGLVTVSIPNSNVNIESDVFKNCTSLASVTIPGTFRLSSLFPNNTITSVTIADGSTSILLGAFSENTTLKTVSIPNSVTSVGDYAFKNCSNISSITIPGEFNIGSIFPQSPITTVAIAEGSTRIVDSAFARREKITTIAIPNSVTNIGQHVFNSCSGLKSISVDPENPKYCSSTNGLLLSKDGKRLIAGVNGNVTIPDCVNVIGTEAFCGYSKLGSVNIPNGVTSIEKDAFYNCTSLSSMSIPNSVTLIGSGAFVGCSNITRVTVPGAFQVSTLFPTTYQSMTSVSIAEGSTIIADGAFSGCGNLSYISIPDGIVSIGNDAFSDCSKMTSIGIPEGVTNIGSCAFANCGRVKYITIPDSVMVLGTSAFWGCSGLKSLTIPRRFDSLNIENTPGLPSDCSIGYYAFFTVVSEHGEPNPEVGEKKRYVDSVSCSVASPVSEGSNQRIRFICPGGRWYSRGMTNAFSGTQVTIPLNDNTVLTWLWKTQYQISITTAGEGTCSFGTQWIDDGTSVTARIVPTVEHIHIFLSGDADNVAINGTTLTIPANKPRNISVTVTKKIGLEVAGVTTVYDGTPKSVSAEASFLGGATAVLRYALAEDGPYSETNPSFTDAGTNTVWVVASAAGEDPITNSAQVVILPKPIEAEMFESVQEQVFDGTAKTPSIVPTADWSTVLTTEDYAAQYENNIEVGVASIIVTGVRNCSGQITIPFTISEPEDTVWHVDAEHGSDENTGRSWVDALRTIQRAADRAVAGNTVLVTNGVYEPFAAMNKDIVIRSIEGADKTIVDGGGTNRCAALGESTNDVVKTTLVGFTLRNGSATEAEANGGGASGGVLEDCVIRENSCWPERSSATGVFGRGGGLCGSIANRCEIVGNHSGNDGGGAYLCMLADCLVSGNSAANKGGYDAGGGMMYCRASRCTIVRNTVGEGTAFTETGGAGANSCVLDSCIVYENAYSTGAEGNAVACTATYSCFGSVVAGTGNIAADPKFVDAANGDFRLAADSPCIDAGNDASVRSATDLAGNERIFGRHVDMGAYENRDFFELAVEGVEVVYNGQPHNVAATATCPGATAILRYALAEEGPYSETNPSFTDAGTNTVWVVASAEGADPITNSAQVVILPKALDASMACVVPDQVFDGTPKTPELHIRDGWPDILSAEDYTVRYEDNTAAGTARIVVEGRRNYAGTIEIPFGIDEPDDTRFLVVDLSGGTNAAAFPVSYLPDVPVGGWTDEYKTTKLVLRKVPAGSFWMGSPEDELGRQDNETLHRVTLSRGFYAGVFEVTQKQWELVMGTNVAQYVGDNRPIEGVAFIDIRGSYAGTNFPASTAVDAESFLGVLREKTGIIGLDLPTEAQWEYACRAKTESALNSGKNFEVTSGQSANANEVGRQSGNCTDGRSYSQHAAVGLYFPNRWGLYDMHGNVFEWCLDRSGLQTAVNPVGSFDGTTRVVKGGCWKFAAKQVRSAFRKAMTSYSRYNDIGFRLVCTEPEPAETVWYVDAERGDDENTGRSWDNALRTIQNAVDRSVAGNTVLVTNGVYEPFTAMNLDIVIRSVEGAEKTIVDGGGTNRCATLGSDTNDVVKTTLVGFTLTSGFANNANGGGACGGVLEDCVIVNNIVSADGANKQYAGGGMYKCWASRCIIANNNVIDAGGGAWGSILTDCLITRNHAENVPKHQAGGGARKCKLIRCTIVGNSGGPGSSSYPGGAGVDDCILESCIVRGNINTTGAASDAYNCTATYSCFGSAVSGTGNIATDPLFVDAANGDYRLTAGSPCIDVGQLTNEAKMGTDLDGHPRWIGAGTDMGCYEWATHYAAATQYVAQATGDDANDGLSWATAKATIQNAIDWAADGDEIVVAAGVYKENESATCGLYNERGANVLIRSTDGPLVTAIDGDGARRVIKGTASSTQNSWKSHALTLDGFTIRNGFSSGVGIAAYCVFRNCIVTGNTAGMAAGLDFCRLENCLVFGNVADAATSSGTTKLFDRTEAVNCTVTGNGIANTTGSSLFARSTVINSVIYGNQVGAGSSFDGDTTVSFSCSETMLSGTGNIAADPKFVDAAIGDYRLAADSPCIDVGAAGYLDLPFDLDGNPRVKGRAIDMGCYESQTVQTETTTTPVPVPFAWLDKYPEALATNGGDYETFGNATAANGADKVWQCYVSGVNPTNATERFLAQIAVTNGTSVVSWTPDLNEGGTKSERVYTVEGKTNLVDQSWGPTNEATRFFRVKVGIP